LGRAPLPQSAIDAACAVARYSNLEFDLDTGKRGRRLGGVGPLLARLMGAEAGTAVNNCAGATVLVLRALCGGREVVVSRGQLVEIGGSFRLPEIFKVAGVKLVEVGSTNITRVEDYAAAITPDTAALLRVHTANYRITGHAEMPGVESLGELARQRGIRAATGIRRGTGPTRGVGGRCPHHPHEWRQVAGWAPIGIDRGQC
jgi:L-seryl-tRNA(Ser) seleniumtransferase